MTIKVDLYITLSTMQDFETRDIVRILGVNPKTLIDWAEIGLIVPDVRGAEGAGTRRRYSERSLVEIAIVKILLGDGIRRELVKNALAYEREYSRPDPLISIPAGTEDPYALVTELEKFVNFYLLFDLHEQSMRTVIVRKAGQARKIIRGPDGKELAEAEELLANLGKTMAAMGRAYLLNVSALKEDIRARLAE